MKRHTLILITSLFMIEVFTRTNAEINVETWMTNPPSQVNHSANVYVQTKAWASTTVYSLSLGAGFEIACPYSGRTVQEQRPAPSVTGYLPRTQPLTTQVWVPSTSVGNYPTTDYESVPAGTCKTCYLYYKATGREAVVALSGLGISISLGGGEKTQLFTEDFQMCKPQPSSGGAGGC